MLFWLTKAWKHRSLSGGRAADFRSEAMKQSWNISALIGCILIVAPVPADWQQQVKLMVPDGYGDFGESVAICADYAIVGAASFDMGAGRAYIFKRDGTNWTSYARLTASDGARNDRFGSSVSISGDYAIVGAPGHGDLDTGAAYIFKRMGGTWIEQAKLSVSYAGAGAAIGLSVSLDGDYAVVGAPGDSSHTGAAYIFRRSGAEWLQQSRLAPVGQHRACDFGRSVSICGEYVIVGTSSPFSYPGCAYIYRRLGTKWVQQAKLAASDGAVGDKFGRSVSIAGYYAAIAATWFNGSPGRVYIFKRDETNWIQQAKLTGSGDKQMDLFGCSVCINNEYLIVGAQELGSRGAAYIFRSGSGLALRQDGHGGAAWIQEAKLTAPDGETPYGFGLSVSISRGNVIVGGTNMESAYVFTMAQ